MQANANIESVTCPFYRTILRHRWWVIAASLAMCAAAGIGLTRLEVDPSARVFLVEGSPEKIALDDLEAAYSRDENIIFVVDNRNGDAFSRDTLRAVEAITEAAWRAPNTRRVDSLTNFQHARANGDDVVIEDLVTVTPAATEADLAAAREIALDRPDVVGRLVSADGAVAAVYLNAIIPPDNHHAVNETVAAARAIAGDVEQRFPDIDVRLTGLLMLDAAMAEASDRDKALLVPAMFVIILAIIMLTLRSLVASGLTLAVIALSVVVAVGLAGWSGIKLNPASSAAPIIIMTLAFASCVHILSTYRFSPNFAQMGKANAISAAMCSNVKAITITSLTTMIGFLSLNFSKVAPFRDLGNIVACGMFASFVLSVILLPALMMVVRLHQAKTAGREHALLGRLGYAIVARRAVVAGVSTAVAFAAVVGIFKIEFDDNFVEYFDHSYDFRVDADYAEDVLSGIALYEYSVPAAGPYGVTEPEYVAALDGFADWLRAQEHVNHVFALPEQIKRINMAMHGDDPAYLRVPDDRETLAQLLLLYELSLPFGLDMTDRILVDKSASRVTVITDNVSSAETRSMADAGAAWLEANAPPYMAATPTGLAYTFAFISHDNTRAMLRGAIIALVMISGILVFAFRSLQIGALSLIPNLLPVAMAFGLWGFFVGEINLAVSVVGTMTLGIIVDDTVHLLSKYLTARRAGAAPDEAVASALRAVGPAVIITSVALILGFGTLALSGFAVNANMGLLAAITIGIALVADLLLLPALLALIDSPHRHPQLHGAPFSPKVRGEI